MADYDPVTLEQFRTRFPKFASQPDPLISALLAEASSAVDNSWDPGDFPTAILYLTAHLLTLETGQTVDRPGNIVSESFGPMSVSYGQTAANASTLDATEYGRRFKELQELNFPPVAVYG